MLNGFTKSVSINSYFDLISECVTIYADALDKDCIQIVGSCAHRILKELEI